MNNINCELIDERRRVGRFDRSYSPILRLEAT